MHFKKHNQGEQPVKAEDGTKSLDNVNHSD